MKKNTEIGKEIKRNESTISRELRRNRYSDAIEYTPDKAHNMAKKRKHVLVRKLNNTRRKILGYRTHRQNYFTRVWNVHFELELTPIYHNTLL